MLTQSARCVKGAGQIFHRAVFAAAAALFQRDVDLLRQREAVDGQLCDRHAQAQRKRAAVQLQLGGIRLAVVGRVAGAVGLVVKDLGAAVKHEHKVGDALHKHLRPGGRAGHSRAGHSRGRGQGRDERFFPQNAFCLADAPPDGALKKRAHVLEPQLPGQRRVQQLQRGLALHFGRQVRGGAVERNALHKRVDGRARPR